MSKNTNTDKENIIKNVICFLTKKPNKLFYDFCEKLISHDYDVYIFIDDNTYNLYYVYGNTINTETHERMINSKVKVIKIDNIICENQGFKSTISWMNGRSSSRDKSLYYFCKINKTIYENFWFLEEDVFIPSVDTIKNIDEKYKHLNSDLLSPSNIIFNENLKDLKGWHWDLVEKQIKYTNPPFGISLSCAIRVSKKLLKCIDEYVDKYKNLFFCEVLFNTISLQNNLKVITPIELSTIVYGKIWKDKEEFDKNYLYHPIKNINEQYNFRKLIN